jgi:hypothetical protein
MPPITVQDLLDSIDADKATLAADQAKLTADQAAQTVDDTTFLTALSSAGVTAFSVPSADGLSVATYTLVPGATPPYTEVVTPTAASITIPAPAVPAT